MGQENQVQVGNKTDARPSSQNSRKSRCLLCVSDPFKEDAPVYMRMHDFYSHVCGNRRPHSGATPRTAPSQHSSKSQCLLCVSDPFKEDVPMYTRLHYVCAHLQTSRQNHTGNASFQTQLQLSRDSACIPCISDPFKEREDMPRVTRHHWLRSRHVKGKHHSGRLPKTIPPLNIAMKLVSRESGCMLCMSDPFKKPKDMPRNQIERWRLSRHIESHHSGNLRKTITPLSMVAAPSHTNHVNNLGNNTTAIIPPRMTAEQLTRESGCILCVSDVFREREHIP